MAGPRGGGFLPPETGGARGGGQGGAPPDRPAAFVLLPGAVPAADDLRARRGGVVARWGVAGQRHAGLPLAAARGWSGRGAAHRLRRHRPPARLVSRRRTDRLRPLRPPGNGADAARPWQPRGHGAYPARGSRRRGPLFAGPDAPRWG